MQTVSIRQQDNFIRLGQAMKKAAIVSSGVEAKLLITDGQVEVNGEIETRRGRKLVPGDVIGYNGEKVTVVGGDA